jgi:hypothetical protein
VTNKSVKRLVFALMVSGRFYIFLIAMRFKRSFKKKKKKKKINQSSSALPQSRNLIDLFELCLFHVKFEFPSFQVTRSTLPRMSIIIRPARLIVNLKWGVYLVIVLIPNEKG